MKLRVPHRVKQETKRHVRRETNMNISRYVKLTRAVSSKAREDGQDEFAAVLDQRVADAILTLPKSERLRLVTKDFDPNEGD